MSNYETSDRGVISHVYIDGDGDPIASAFTIGTDDAPGWSVRVYGCDPEVDGPDTGAVCSVDVEIDAVHVTLRAQGSTPARATDKVVAALKRLPGVASAPGDYDLRELSARLGGLIAACAKTQPRKSEEA